MLFRSGHDGARRTAVANHVQRNAGRAQGCRQCVIRPARGGPGKEGNVVDVLASVQTTMGPGGEASQPVQPVVMKTITIQP